MLCGVLGALGRRFESCRPDQLYQLLSANNKLHPKKVAPKLHPKVIFSKIVGTTLEVNLVLGSARLMA